MSAPRPVTDDIRLRSLMFELSQARDRIADLERELAATKLLLKSDLPIARLRGVRGHKATLLNMLLRKRRGMRLTVDEASMVMWGRLRPNGWRRVSYEISVLRSMLEPIGATISTGRGGKGYAMTDEHRRIVRMAWFYKPRP